MFVGKVIGTVWSTVKWPQLQGLKLLVVRPYHLADLSDRSDLPVTLKSHPSGAVPTASAANPTGGPDSEAVVCVDLLDAGVGDDVVVAFGHAARVAAQNHDPPSGPQNPGDRKNSGSVLPGPPSPASGAIVPVDAAVVAIVDSIRVARPST